MAKRKSPASKKTTPVASEVTPLSPAKSNLKWIIGGIAFLLILVFVAFTLTKEDKVFTNISTPSSQSQEPGSMNQTNNPVANEPSAKTTINELSKKITGDWYVKERLIAGQPTTKGKIGMGSWQFYDDGSLKYTTSQYADLGTWKAEEGNFSVSLYALGSYSGTVTAIDAKTMTWITNETIDGQPVAVTNRLARSK